MAQFTKYTSADASAPVLSGTAGSLIAVLKACLVDGYGSKAAAGWTQPVATSGNIGSFKQGAAAKAGFGFVVNDNGPNVTSTFKEAWITGYKIVGGVGSPVGSGAGQFPLPPQALTTGHLVARKSVTASAVARAWTLFADDRTMYFFARTGDFTVVGVENYHDFGFGEFYSNSGSADLNNCFLLGRSTENIGSNSTQYGGVDAWTNFKQDPAYFNGQYVADSVTGGAGSFKIARGGDWSRMAGAFSSAPQTAIGTIPAPNGPDGNYYISPARLLEANGYYRGTMRGLVYPLHSNTAFANGAVITGSGALTGRTYEVVIYGANAGLIAIETSNTLDTN